MSAAQLAGFLVLALGLWACGGDPADSPSSSGLPAPAAAPDPATPDADTSSDSLIVGDPATPVPGPLDAPPRSWTTRTTSVARQTPATLTEVRTATHDGFDRIVFTFDGPVPGYHVEYVDRPQYTCGAGDAVFLEGDAWLLVRFQPAQAHTEAGEPTIGERRRSLGLPVLREVMMTCDFEADVTWVLGLAAPGGYQMAELDKPSRLIVDVRN